MKSLYAGFLLALMAALVVGCGQESEPGGPGVDTDVETENHEAENGDEGRKVVDEERTFRINVPGDTSLARGKSESIDIGVERGDAFQQALTITFQAPAGITVSPETLESETGQDELKATIQVADDAKLGDQTVTVRAKPETGADVTEKFTITVEEAEEGEGANSREANRDEETNLEEKSVREEPSDQP